MRFKRLNCYPGKNAKASKKRDVRYQRFSAVADTSRYNYYTLLSQRLKSLTLSPKSIMQSSHSQTEKTSMKKSDLIEALSKETGLPLKKAGEVVNIVFNGMEDALLRGERVEIRGFCSIRVKHYRGYVGRNPKTGDGVRVSPRKLPLFKCSKELKRRVTPEKLALKRREPREIIDEYYSVEFSTSEIEVSHQFKLRDLSPRGICIMAREESSILKHLMVGDILNMRYYKADLPEPSDYIKTEIRHITREEGGRFKGHYLIGLAIHEARKA